MSLIVFLALLLSCCGYALWQGGAPERVAAGAQIGAFAINLPLHFAFEGSRYGETISATALLDVMLLIGLVVLAWRSTRYWPLYLAGCQFAAIVGHLAKTIDPTMQATGYAVQAQIWAYPMLILTAAGAWRHRARRRTGDPDPAWKVFYN